ncbi:peptidylprolyl isomerase [Pannus brasiliensis CCIBt3594]|uniref:peptidylprolyl isomerase n=1 Tax=Pannus brasiliensis CCIBt3594 TaxID=1427578 RepID=A0AAW9QKY2_9CHRO
MTAVIAIGDQKIEDKELFPLLAKYGMLTQLAREIIIDRAIADIDCTPEEENFARSRFYQQNQIASEERVQDWLRQNGMTAEQLDRLVSREIKLEKFKQQAWESKLESYFLQVKEQLDKVVYSLIRTKDAGIAQELFFRIQEGENTFAELAKEYSQGAEAQTGGLIGPVELHVPHPQIGRMLASSKPGQLWPPARIGDWIVILRLEKYLSCELDPPTRQRLRDDLFQQWLAGQLQTVSFPGEIPANVPVS